MNSSEKNIPMKEYEYRRTVFYQLRGHESFPDEHKNFEIIHSEETTIEDAVTYLKDGTSYLRFPGAARAVAIAAAQVIATNFGEPFFDVLDDPKLMHGNDPYFKRYSEDRVTYDRILSEVAPGEINWESERMIITKTLLMEEYMLDEAGISILDRF